MAENSKNVQIRNLKKVFPQANGEELEVLHDINLDIKDGEFVSIVGNSGCGKSTLIRIIAGLETATEGEILIGGNNAENITTDTGLIFQESRLFSWLNVEKNIEFGIQGKLSAKEKKEKIKKYLELVELTGFEKSLPNQLSGGMQQRVSIARTLINEPSLLLLDEPFGALDALTRINMQSEITRIWKEQKTTMILVTHDIDEAIFLSDRIVILSPRPGQIKKIIDVNIPRPRKRTSIEFSEIRRTIYKEFFDESDYDIEFVI